MFQSIIFCVGQNYMKKPQIFQDDWEILLATSYCGDAAIKPKRMLKCSAYMTHHSNSFKGNVLISSYLFFHFGTF